MEEILRLKIKNAETASVEIVPVDDGVEILVLRKPAGRPEKEFHDERKNERNLEILRAFCSKEKEKCEDKEDRGELKRFWDFWSEKVGEWKGKLDCERLWKNWQKTAQR